MSLTWLWNEYVELNDTYPLWERLVIGNRRLDIPVIYINEPFLGNGIVGQQVIADEFEEVEQHMSSIGHIFIVNGRVDDDRRKSHPSWVRGLKSHGGSALYGYLQVSPFMGKKNVNLL